MEPDWTKTEDYDALYLAGQRVPGVVKVNVSLPSGLDVQKPKGGKKATIRDNGHPPAEVDIEVTLLPKQMDDFSTRIVPILRPRSKHGGRDPVDIAHPQCRRWGINVITSADVDDPHPRTGGVKVIKIHAFEWAPAPAKVKKAKTKPKNADPAGWDVQPLIDGLSPAKNNGAAINFFEPPRNPNSISFFD